MAEKKMIIDGVSCPFTTERNVLEVARNNGIDIPRFATVKTCPSTALPSVLVENDRGKMDAACSMHRATAWSSTPTPSRCSTAAARRCSCS